MVVELSAGQFHDDVLLHLAKEGARYQSVGLCNRLGGMVVTVDQVVAAAHAEMKK